MKFGNGNVSAGGSAAATSMGFEGLQPLPPAWAQALGAGGIDTHDADAHVCRAGRFLLAEVACSAGAGRTGGPGELEEAVAEAYRRLLDRLRVDPPWHLVRIWNFVPGILDAAGEGMDRYMRFNAGRHRAFARSFGGTGAFDRLLPAASAIGHGGPRLTIHALACREPGIAIVNPRQRPPHCYSRRFGPLPPCFARATLVTAAESSHPALLMIGGTASVRGEDTVHVDDLPAQLDETFTNLNAVIDAARASNAGAGRIALSQLRVYHKAAGDLPEICKAVARAFPGVGRIEFMHADLCRPDLLVEIEGLATPGDTE